MRASYFLYNLGIPILLKGTITLTTENGIHSFRSFLVARTYQERAHLRKLKIRNGEWHLRYPVVSRSSVRTSFAAILRHATHLESLEIEVCRPIFKTRYPIAIKALASMTTLRHLALGNASYARNAIHTLLEDLSSPISTLVIDGSIDANWNSMPVILLRMKDSMTRLSLSVVPMFLPLMQLQLPHVEELSLTVQGELVSPEYLPRVFPKLKGLSMTKYEWMWGSEEEGTIIRRRHGSFGWSSLDFVSSDPESLLHFGTTCPIRYAHTCSVDSSSFSAFSTFLTSAKPSVLRFEFTLSGSPMALFNIDVDPLYDALSAIPHLVELYIGFTFVVVNPADSARFTDAWVSSVSRTRTD